MERNFDYRADIAVVGAGHAGVEAALAAARLGFDTVLFDVDFPYQEMRNELISDEACFNTILEHLPTEADAAPAFILNVTIQNHGGFKVRDDFEQVITSTREDDLFLESELYHSLLSYSDAALPRAPQKSLTAKPPCWIWWLRMTRCRSFPIRPGTM